MTRGKKNSCKVNLCVELVEYSVSDFKVIHYSNCRVQYLEMIVYVKLEEDHHDILNVCARLRRS